MASILRDLKRVIKRVLRRVLLPEELIIEEVDMVACHTGIYAGLMGKTHAPCTWDAYHSESFWDQILSSFGPDIPKQSLYLKLFFIRV